MKVTVLYRCEIINNNLENILQFFNIIVHRKMKKVVLTGFVYQFMELAVIA